MDLKFLYTWLGLMLFLTIAAPTSRALTGKKKLSAEAFVSVGFAIGGMIALANVLLKLLNQEQLRSDLGDDGTVALLLGIYYGSYLSLKEVIKLFFER